MIFKKKIKWVPFPRVEGTKVLNNPYCGLYSIFRFYGESIINKDNGTSLEDITIDSSQRLSLIIINLINFNNKPLSLEVLLNIKRIFNYFISYKKQLILRFVYDWDGKGIVSEPKDVEYILKHMEQLSDILKEYEEHIYIIQGLFIGSWGEMHSSRYLNERSLVRLAKRLYDCSGERTQIALRCPSYWRTIFKTYNPLDDETAFSQLIGARLSLFNDGMLGSDTDFGTYGSAYSKEATSYSEKWIRKDELEFQNKLCKYVSNGGEVINDNIYNDGIQAIESLRTMRVSYLNSQYDEQVLSKWKSTKTGLSDPLWRDKSVYDYIEAHLGYRFVIKDVKLNILLRKRDSIKVLIRLCNMGFAPCYHSFDVKLAIRSEDYSEFFEYRIDTDTRFWIPEDIIEIDKIIQIEMLEKERYILCFSIYDSRTGRPIEVSNTFETVDYRGYYSMGEFVI